MLIAGVTASVDAVPPVVTIESQTITTNNVASGGSPFNINMPGTRPDGDVYLLAVVSTRGGTVSVPGWTSRVAIPISDTAGGQAAMSFLTRTGSSEPATYSLTYGGEYLYARVIRLSGATETGIQTASGGSANRFSVPTVINPLSSDVGEGGRIFEIGCLVRNGTTSGISGGGGTRIVLISLTTAGGDRVSFEMNDLEQTNGTTGYTMSSTNLSANGIVSSIRIGIEAG